MMSPHHDHLGGVTARVDAIVKHFNIAAEIIQRVKANRADKQKPAPSRYLEETIQCSPEDVEREKERGLGRFGLAFEQGDDTALDALHGVDKDLTKMCQELQSMAQSEELADFKNLVDVVDSARDHAIDALIRLRQRCLATETKDEDGRHSSDTSITTLQSMKDAPVSPSSEQPSKVESPAKTYHFPQHHNPWLRLPHRSHSTAKTDSRDVSGDEDAQSGAEHHHKKHGHGHSHHHHGHGSILHFLKHHRTHSHDQKPAAETHAEEQRRLLRAATSPTTISNMASRNGSVISLDISSAQIPWWSTDDAPPALERQSSEMSHRDSKASVDTIVPISPTSHSYRSRAASTATNTIRNSSLAVPTPTQDNDFLGFCKGAVRLQNGDKKAFEKRREFNDGWSQSTVYYLACSSKGCAFAGHIDVNVIQSKLFILDNRGLQFRWPFLAKSHVAQQKVQGNLYSYQCLFCVYSGERSAVYYGSDAYMDHVATHRGEIGAVTLYKARCINDHIADDTEEFDINLYPLSPDEAKARRFSELLSDDMMSLQMSPYSSGKNDSVLSATDEPWNEGLSDFHYKDAFERGEMG